MGVDVALEEDGLGAEEEGQEACVGGGWGGV